MCLYFVFCEYIPYKQCVGILTLRDELDKEEKSSTDYKERGKKGSSWTFPQQQSGHDMGRDLAAG